MFTTIVGFKPGPGLFRFILAFMVLIFHTISFFPLGHYAVYVFFMLSGYWIFKMFEEKYSRYTRAYWVYIRSRLLRVVFVYWLVMILAMITFFITNAILHNNSWQQFSLTEILIKNLLILGINSSPIMFISPAWSLDIEIQFYIVAPVFVLLRRYIDIKAQFFLSILLLAVILYLVPHSRRMSSLFLYLPFFLSGAWLYYAGKTFSAFSSRLFLLIAAGVIIVNFMIPSLREAFLIKRDPLYGADQYQDHVNILLALLTIPFLSRNITQKVTDPNDSTWSSMSFVLYLVHWPLLRVYNTVLTLQGEQHKFLYLLIYYVTTLLVSYFITIKYDRHFEGIRRRWLGKQEKAPKTFPAFSN